MRHLDENRDVLEAVGVEYGTLTDEQRTKLERLLDEIFQRGYDVGHTDGMECVE
jgi:hypothetical protein